MRNPAELRIALARSYGGDPLLQHARGEISAQCLRVLIKALPAEHDQQKEN